MKVAVVTPTYNERENIVFLIENIFSLKIPDLELFVVDDNSPDKTYEVVLSLADKYEIPVYLKQTLNLTQNMIESVLAKTQKNKKGWEDGSNIFYITIIYLN